MSDASSLAPALWGIPVVADSASRDAAFPLATRSQDQRVFNKGTGNIERWSGSSWRADVVGFPVLAGEAGVVDTSFPFGNVRRYGAVGDGVADDSAAVQAALTAVRVRGGGTVTIPNTGTGGARYLLNTVGGTSGAYRYLLSGGGYTGLPVAIAIVSDGATLVTGLVASDTTTITVLAYLYGDLVDLLVDGVVFEHTHGLTIAETTAIVLEGGASNAQKRPTVRRCVFKNFSRDIMLTGVESPAILYNKFRSTLGRDSGSTTTTNPNVCIWSFVNANGQTSDALVHGNDLDGCTSGDVSTATNKSGKDGLVYGASRGWTITGNRVRRHGYEAIYPASRQSYEASRGFPCVIDNNTVDCLEPTGAANTNFGLRTDEHDTTIGAGNRVTNARRGVLAIGTPLAVSIKGLTIDAPTVVMGSGNVDYGIHVEACDRPFVAGKVEFPTAPTSANATLDGVSVATSDSATVRARVRSAGLPTGGKTLRGIATTTCADVTAELMDVTNSTYGWYDASHPGGGVDSRALHVLLTGVTTAFGGDTSHLRAEQITETVAVSVAAAGNTTPSLFTMRQLRVAAAGNVTINDPTVGGGSPKLLLDIKNTTGGAITVGLGASYLGTFPAPGAGKRRTQEYQWDAVAAKMVPVGAQSGDL